MGLFTSLSLQEVSIPAKLEYLDLASGTLAKKSVNSPELMTRNIPSVTGILDIALSPNTVLVPHGQVKLFNKVDLGYRTCGEFVLFPNLPMEIQCNIFKLCSDAEPRRITLFEVEDDNGARWIEAFGAKRPMIFAASKLALEDALVLKRYVPLFATHNEDVKIYFRSGHDWAQLGASQQICPRLDLASTLANPSDLDSIKTLQISHDTFFARQNWSNTNIAFMCNLQVLHITAVFVDPGRAEYGSYKFTLKDILQTRKEYHPFCVAPNGRPAAFQYAVDAINDYICSYGEKMRLIAIHNQLNVFLNTVPNFPLQIELFFSYSPAIGFPLAPHQPRRQPR